MKEKYRCSTKNCRGEPSVNYLGKWLCDYCWSKHCEEEENGMA